ncbi:hypothetical protein YC2023_056731 [Brassica napus]
MPKNLTNLTNVKFILSEPDQMITEVSIEDNGSIFLACDTIMNILLRMKQISFSLEWSTFSSLLKVLVYWTSGANDPSVVIMAASICSLIFDFTSEDRGSLGSLAQFIAKNVSSSDHATSDTIDLPEIKTAGYSRWVDRFHTIKKHNR